MSRLLPLILLLCSSCVIMTVVRDVTIIGAGAAVGSIFGPAGAFSGATVAYLSLKTTLGYLEEEEFHEAMGQAGQAASGGVPSELWWFLGLFLVLWFLIAQRKLVGAVVTKFADWWTAR